MKFKSDIEVQAGLKDSSGSNGTSGQVLSSSVSGVAWTNVNTTATDVQNLVKAGVAINKGQAVYVTSADGTNIIVGLASNTSEATSSKTLGLLDATVAINGMANVVQIGRLAGLNTIGAIAGDPVWLGTNGNLIYGLANKPYAPLHLVFIGIVTRVNSNNGEIFINVQNGFELNEIHDVDLKTNIPISGDVLGYDGTLWVNKTIAGWLGYTPADDANVVKLTGNQTINGEKTFAGTIYSDNATYLKQYTSFSNQTDYTNIGGQLEGIYIGTTSASSTISMTNLTAFRAYELPDASGTIALTSDITGFVPYTGATSNVNLGTRSISASNYILGGATGNTGLYYGHTNKVVLANYVVGGGIDFETNGGATNMILDAAGDLSVVGNVTANSFIKIGGNSTQYLKADGSVSTAMNSRIEVNFIATAGQTTFVTPYEVGQIDVYYNGSKLYPNEFTATNGTDVILATGATLNAQISIVKYVSSLSTTAIRNETTFTTTAGQTTFAVNYSPGQVDVFYNGSKLNISEFTATNGTSVVLGFACAAGESIVIDSYVNQISGASGTANKVAKFTGAASLGDSSIYDDGTRVGIGTILPKTTFQSSNTSTSGSLPSLGSIGTGTSIYLTNNNFDYGLLMGSLPTGNSWIQTQRTDATATAYDLLLQPNGGNILIGTTTSTGAKLQVNGIISSGISASTQGQIILHSTTASAEGNIYGRSGGGMLLNTNSNAHPIEFGGSKVYFNSNVGLGIANPLSGGGASKWLTLEGSIYSGGVICSINGVSTGALYSESGYFNMQASSGYGIKLFSNGGEALKIDTSGRVTTPQMPSFRAWYSINATWTLASNATFNFDVTEYNVGGCYNVSNGIFTAPVAGVYQFNFYTIVLGTYVNAAISFRKNGGIPTSGYNVHFSPTSTSNWSNVVYTTSMYLNQGDYVNVINSSGFSVNFHGKDWSSFSGYLVG